MTLLKLPRFLSKGAANNKNKLELIRNQIDFFWSFRLRRSYQIYNFYQKWNEKALREFLKSMRNNIVSVAPATLVRSSINWHYFRLFLAESQSQTFNVGGRIVYF